MAYSDFSTSTKNKICRLMGIIPTKLYLKILFKIKTGTCLYLDNPTTYTEKLNWLKVYDQNPLYTRLVDKYAVREYVADRIGEEHLIPLIGRWDSFDEIDFDTFPQCFVLKCNHDFGSVVIVKDKSKMDIEAVKKSINNELKYNFYYRGREWAYKNVKPQIIAEQLMDDGNQRLIDYKFFCFGGKVYYMFIAIGRGTDLRFDFFDRDYNHLDITNGVPNSEQIPVKPSCYDEMIEMAEKLSRGINNVRVDFYEICGNVYFSEMTFYHDGGMVPMIPREMDVKFGENFIMKKYNNKNGKYD